MTKIPYTSSPKSISVLVGGQMRTVNSSHPAYGEIFDVVNKQDQFESTGGDVASYVTSLLSVAEYVADKSDGEVEIVGGKLYYGKAELHNGLAKKIIQMFQDGHDISFMVEFLRRCRENPRPEAVDELYDWVEAGDMPICPDGHFIAFKKVQDDYLDFYTRTIEHRVGSRPSVPRESVDDNRNNVCSRGLHFCSREYLPNYHGSEGRVMIVKVNPADVVSIPVDYSFTKGRCWIYEVIGEIARDDVGNTFIGRDSSAITKYGTYDGTELVVASKVVLYGGHTAEHVLEVIGSSATLVMAAETLKVHPDTLRKWRNKIAAAGLSAPAPVSDVIDYDDDDIDDDDIDDTHGSREDDSRVYGSDGWSEEDILEVVASNKTKVAAAKQLGVHPDTLRKWLIAINNG